MRVGFGRRQNGFVPKFQTHVDTIDNHCVLQAWKGIFIQSLEQFMVSPRILMFENHGVVVVYGYSCVLRKEASMVVESVDAKRNRRNGTYIRKKGLNAEAGRWSDVGWGGATALNYTTVDCLPIFLKSVKLKNGIWSPMLSQKTGSRYVCTDWLPHA